jgi:hypothetical protein
MIENWETHWKDYYKILQVHTSAEPEVIKAAYDRLARKYHPDVNRGPTATTRMQDINEAFEVLSNPEKRQRYHTVWLQKTGTSHPVQESSTDISTSIKGQTKAGRVRKRFINWGILVIGLIAIGIVVFLINQARAPELNSIPDVKIQSIILPSNPKVSSGDLVYTHTFRVVNNELDDMRIYWECNSSITGKLDSGYVTVSEKSSRDITRNYYYTNAGTEEVTYSISYNGSLLDTYSATHNISQ